MTLILRTILRLTAASLAVLVLQFHLADLGTVSAIARWGL